MNLFRHRAAGVTFCTLLVHCSALPVSLPFKNNRQSQAMSVNAPRGGGGAIITSQQKTIQQMSYAELKERKEYWKKEQYAERVLLYLRHMLNRCDDVSERADILLELADLLFSMKKFDEAHAQYQEFLLLFPGHDKLAYTHYQLIECCNNRLNAPDRDQTVTKQLIELCTQFCTDYPAHDLTKKVTELQDKATNLLAQHELHIMQHYVTSKKYASAARRFAYFTEQFSEVDAEHKITAAQIAQQLQELTGFSPDQLITQQAEIIEKEQVRA